MLIIIFVNHDYKFEKHELITLIDRPVLTDYINYNKIPL